MRQYALPLIFGLSLALIASSVQAQPPRQVSPNPAPQQSAGLNNLLQSNNGPDINAAYAVTPDAGAWMVCVASYQGPNAPELANKLCTYLRERRYPAYVFNRGNAERKKFQDDLDRWQSAHPGQTRKWRLAHMQEEQLAVLIGGFRDDKAAGAEVKKVRKWDLPNLKLKSGKPAFDTYDVYDKSKSSNGYEMKRYPINPFHTAMAVPNPTIPRQPKKAAKVDPFWKELNAHEPRSLFKCPKPWTLVVQEFRGASVIQPQSASSSFLQKLGFSDHNLGRKLDNSARMAQQVCDMFKKLGFTSYVLHTRGSSVVTVGEFDSLNDPALLRTQDQLSKFSFKKGETQKETAFKLFAKAIPMEVPR